MMQRFDLTINRQQVTLGLDSRLYDPKNTSILGPHDYFDAGAGSDLQLNLCHGKRRRAFSDDDFLKITHYRAKAGSHIIRQLVSYLAACHSRAFDVVHGAGLLADSRRNLGVLLVGRAHCGKSTLSARLGNIILDDDLMLVTRDEMRVAGKMGFVSYKHPENGRKYLTPLRNGVKAAHIDLVFVLDRNQRGGTVMDVDNSIPRRFAVHDELPPLFRQAYLRLPAIRVDAPIFRLGTRGKLEQTLQRAQAIVDEHI